MHERARTLTPNLAATVVSGSGNGTTSRSANDEYVELKCLVKDHGLFERQPAYYTFKFISTLFMLIAAVLFLFINYNLWLLLLNAVFAGFVFGQIAALGHDIGHHQVFRRRRWIQLSTLALDVVIGLSLSWWIDRHNRHHAHPNQFDVDPDVDTPFFSFRSDAARKERAIQRFLVRHQVYIFVPAQLFLAVVFRVWSVQFLLQTKAKHPRVELLLVAVHFVLYVGLLLSCLTLAQTILFVVVHQAFFGVYLGSIIAPNHKGMPTLDKDTSMDYLHRQVLTARNVRAHPVVDFWYGGLNYQIEHHLFPSVPRNKLRKLQTIVKAFCASHSIAYYETGMLQSYREILHGLQEASTALGGESLAPISPP